MAIYSQSAMRSSAGLLLYFADTMPSLDHDCIWRALEAMRLPAVIVTVVQLLCKVLVTDLLYKGRVVDLYHMASGIMRDVHPLICRVRARPLGQTLLTRIYTAQFVHILFR